MATETIELPEVVLSCHVVGEPAAVPVVLLHGLGRDGASWAPVTDALAHRHRVVAPDLRGHGASGRPGRYGFLPMRDDLLALIDALGVDMVDVVGHSMGGNVGILLAEEHPDRVRRLVVVDVAPPRGAGEYDPPPAVPEEPVPFDWPLLAAVLHDLARPDPAWWDKLGEITAPTLLLSGAPDSHVDPVELAAAAAAIPDCRLVTVGGGHRLHLTRIPRFLAEVGPFLA